MHDFHRILKETNESKASESRSSGGPIVDFINRILKEIY